MERRQQQVPRAHATVSKIKTRVFSGGESFAFSVGQPCTASLAASFCNRCKRICDAHAEIEALAERTKRMRYQRGFWSQRLLFYTDAFDSFYSKHPVALACSQPPGGNKNLRVTSKVSWGSSFFHKCSYEFLKVAYLSNELMLWRSLFLP